MITDPELARICIEKYISSEYIDLANFCMVMGLLIILIGVVLCINDC